MIWQGTYDMTAWLSAAAALTVFRALGAARVRAHNHSTLLKGVEALRIAWGPTCSLGEWRHLCSLKAAVAFLDSTQLVSEILKFCSVPAGADSDDACMAAIEVPTSWLAAANATGCTNVATQLHFQLRERHHVEVRDATYRLSPASCTSLTWMTLH